MTRELGEDAPAGDGPRDPEPGEDAVPQDAPRGRGRPRDPGLDARALLAALEIFGQKGWAGLTIDAVASRAHVGKSSLYLRWPDREALLAAALRSIQSTSSVPAAPADQREPGAEPGAEREGAAESGAEPAEPSLREYLMAHARRRADLYLGEHGLAMLRLYVEARANPELFVAIREEAITRFVRDERRRVEDAIASGDLPPTASAVRILDAVEGAIFMHILVTPPGLVARVRAGMDDYISAMVDDQLRAARLSPPGS